LQALLATAFANHGLERMVFWNGGEALVQLFQQEALRAW
jgi:hypothetical protein